MSTLIRILGSLVHYKAAMQDGRTVYFDVGQCSLVDRQKVAVCVVSS